MPYYLVSIWSKSSGQFHGIRLLVHVYYKFEGRLRAPGIKPYIPLRTSSCESPTPLRNSRWRARGSTAARARHCRVRCTRGWRPSQDGRPSSNARGSVTANDRTAAPSQIVPSFHENYSPATWHVLNNEGGINDKKHNLIIIKEDFHPKKIIIKEDPFRAQDTAIHHCFQASKKRYFSDNLFVYVSKYNLYIIVD